jgi:Protein of unknown function (DUF2628)
MTIHRAAREWKDNRGMTPSSLETLPGTTTQTGADLPPVLETNRFVAVHIASFQRHYEKALSLKATHTRDALPTRLPFVLSWHWPAFLVTVPWMFYRKMYSGGIILVALPVFLDHILPGSLFLGSGLLIAITAGICGKSWYLEHAVRRITKSRRVHDNEDARAAYLERARGVSLAAGIFGALIQIVSATVIIMDLLPPDRF